MSHTTVVKTIMALIIIALHMHSSQLLPGAPSARHCLSRTEIRVIAGNRMIKASKKQKKKKKKKTKGKKGKKKLENPFLKQVIYVPHLPSFLFWSFRVTLSCY